MTGISCLGKLYLAVYFALGRQEEGSHEKSDLALFGSVPLVVLLPLFFSLPHPLSLPPIFPLLCVYVRISPFLASFAHLSLTHSLSQLSVA